MKQFLMLSAIVLATTVYGQNSANKTNGLVIKPQQSLTTDTTLKVVYMTKSTNTQEPAYFLNGKFVDRSLLATLDPKIIDSINVAKGIIQIDSVEYNGQIYIKTKSSYNPKLISLTNLKDKYTNLKNKFAAFMIDGNIVNADYDKYMVDENDVLQIIVDNIKNAKQNIDIAFIKLLTKSDENIKKTREIRIRGAEVAKN